MPSCGTGAREGRSKSRAFIRRVTASFLYIGHVVPVPDPEKRRPDEVPETASYRVYMTEAQAQEVFAILGACSRSRRCGTALRNCVAFIQAIAIHMGCAFRWATCSTPEDWVNQLRSLNGGRKFMPAPA